ncbi:MAG: sulfate transporter [Xanthomonadales bacterium]|nr:sulfate transporter [Xanthomonadales bacterium]
MKKSTAAALAASRILASAIALSASMLHADETGFIIVASTTSTQNSGLFDHLLPEFQAATGIEARVVALGTGAALAYGERCDADVVMVHAPALEREFVENGYGLERIALMHNDFVIVGPRNDPAGIRGADSAAGAIAAVGSKRAPFVSRGDRSGTHTKELALWRESGLDPTRGAGAWYVESGSGMGQSLNMARAMDAYILVDRGTWLSFGNRGGLQLLVEGDPALFNPYSVIAIDPEHCPNVRLEQAQAFIDWLVSETGQEAIGRFRVAGQPLFIPHHQQRRAVE